MNPQEISSLAMHVFPRISWPETEGTPVFCSFEKRNWRMDTRMFSSRVNTHLTE
jgi:hypothetical protein